MNAITPPAIAEVASLRARLGNAGFRPVALKTGDKMPVVNGWPERARRNPPADAEDTPTSNALNTGILCDGLRVIDIDVDDAHIVPRLRALASVMLGDTVCIRTRDNSPRIAMIYRAAEGQPAKRALSGRLGKIEVLGKGNQLHAFGRHPTGAELRWEAPPHETPVDTLPAVTEAQISSFLAAAAPLIGAELGRPAQQRAQPGGEHQASARGAGADPLDVTAALAVIPNDGVVDWEYWNRIGLAVYTATGGDETGRAAWHSWSRRNPAYDEAATEARWKHYATHRDREMPAGKAPIGAGALFHMAAEARPGWKPPSAGTGARPAAPNAKAAEQPDPDLLASPDMSVLRVGRRSPPALPLDLFGPHWAPWLSDAAEAAAAPVDYVALPLLAAASALTGNACWAQATDGWCEPPHIWAGVVGDSGSSKSPGADCLFRDVLPVIEQRMMGDFPDRQREWKAAAEAHAASVERWKVDVKEANKKGNPPPLPPADSIPPEPQAPRLRQSDTTIERVATLLATAAPKGLLFVRDELAGLLKGMNSYNEAGRAFWLEAYGGRPYRVERQKSPEPINVPRNVVAVTGGTQPERLAEMMFNEADDGLFARFVWAWPDPLPFKLGQKAPNAAWAVEALDRLRLLPLVPGAQPGDPPRPMNVPLTQAARAMLEAFGQDMQRAQQEAGGLMRSAYGKARGLALRVSLVLTMLRWCGEEGFAPPPAEIDDTALADACDLVADYFIPMAQRVYGDAATTQAERNAATLARWIRRERATEVHVRKLLREVRLPGLASADAIHSAAARLVEAGWLHPPTWGGGTTGRPRAAYRVNPVVQDLPA